MWPDMGEYTHQYPAPGFTNADGTQAYLYSPQDQQTVDVHFDWMQDYGIDGVVLQRFVTAITTHPEMTNVLNFARAAAKRTGRIIALEYSIKDADTNTLFSQLTNDWINLAVNQKLTDDPRYVHQDGKPVLLMNGFYSSRFTNNAALPQRIIDWFETNTVQNVFLIGSGEWWWRTDTAPGWSNIFRSFNGYCPWNTGYTMAVGTNRYANTTYWSADLTEAARVGMFYLPEIYPGDSRDNELGTPPGTSKIDRLGGDFLWQQFYTVRKLGLDAAFVGMFDEVNEGTEIFKVSNTPPTQGYSLTYEGMPPDWYLRLTAEGAKVLSGEVPNSPVIPISP
jgi:hypothetical protein